MSQQVSDYDYHLPEALIAHYPASCRDGARMMVLDRLKHTIDHRFFAEFPSFLKEGDLVVLNDTKVVPARVFSDDGKIELLFLEKLPLPELPENESGSGKESWKCLVRPGRKLPAGKKISLQGNEGRVAGILADGERIMEFAKPVDLDAIGRMPLPPYIKRELTQADKERYQTVYAREGGSVAAPTAGLHFTKEILKVVPHVFVTLHVGVGTFQPVRSGLLAEHHMHRERFEITADAAKAINAAKRIVAIGTTTTRVLESVMRREGKIMEGEGWTDLFLYPPASFQIVGAMLTNFHLPKSTLLMLAAAFSGKEFLERAYAEAVKQSYRFYSYGDCMLVL